MLKQKHVEAELIPYNKTSSEEVKEWNIKKLKIDKRRNNDASIFGVTETKTDVFKN